jgi:flagellar hook protein FlgE
MSLSGALSSAISGLSAQSQALAMVSDNLANSSTTGYKTTSGTFEDMVTGSSDSLQYSSGGVSVYSQQNVTQQGLLETTTDATNVAIQGQGFFVVSSSPTGGGTTSYTRNGDFLPDSQGYLEDNGSYLMGYRTDASGNTISNTLAPINTTIAETSAAASTETTMQLNLPADAATNATFSTSMSVYDSLGAASTVPVTWTKTASNTWTAAFGTPTSTVTGLPDATGTPTVTTTTNGTAQTFSPMTVTFNPDGSLALIDGKAPTNPSSTVLSISGWNDGAAASAITLNLGSAGGTDGLTQYNSGSSSPAVAVTSINSDGLAFGKLSAVTIGNNGLVNATYSNGQTVPIYQIPVATFASPDQLSAQSDGLYQATVGSGNPVVQSSGANGAGTIFGSELEASATNTNDQFSTMMTAQQAYSASAQVVTTVNKMFDTLISAMR